MELESKLERLLMWEGKKNVARKILREAAQRVVRDNKKHWNEQLQMAVAEAGPGLSLRSRRRGSQKVKVPFPMRAEQRRNLGMRWLVEEARKTSGGSMGERLAKVIMETAEGKGKVVERVRNQHKEVERNRGNAFLRWLYKITFLSLFRYPKGSLCQIPFPSLFFSSRKFREKKGEGGRRK